MTDIKGISPESGISQVKHGQTAQPQSPDEIKREHSVDEAARQDSLHVDQKRREIAHLVENARLLLEELPEVRSDRVELARRRLRAGYYDRREILEETAGKILEEFAEMKPIDENAKSSDRVERANRRLASGYYEQPDILDETADKILKKNVK